MQERLDDEALASAAASESLDGESDAETAMSCRIDRGLGLRRALSDETQSRPFLPLGGEVLHVAWLRGDASGRVTREEGENDRECVEALLEHYLSTDTNQAEELLRRVERGWNDVTLTLGNGYYCRLQRYSEYDTLTLSGPGAPDTPLDAPVNPWQDMLPPGWLSTVPGRVFLCIHVEVRNTDPELDSILDDNDLWNELQTVTNAVGWEKRARDGGVKKDTNTGAAQQEAMEAIAEEIQNAAPEDPEFGSEDEETEFGLDGYGGETPEGRGPLAASRLDTETAAMSGVKIIEVGAEVKNGAKNGAEKNGKKKKEEARVKKAAAFGTVEWQREQRVKREREEKKAKAHEKAERNLDAVAATPARWQSWGTQVESNRIVGMDLGGGARFYANYHLDEEGGMSCLLLSPRGASVIQAARQLQRYFTIEQYRLLILARLPGAKSRYPTLSKLYANYESVAQNLRRMNASTKVKGNIFQRLWKQLSDATAGSKRYKVQQDFLETITELEQATAQELARSKSEATTAHAYAQIIETRFAEANFQPLGGEVRFLPPFVHKRLDPAISTINSVTERAQILSDALERTTGLLQAGVEVRLQRLNERIAMYGLVFTVLSAVFGAASAIAYEGPFQRAFFALCRWLLDKFTWMSPAASILGV